MKLPDHATSSTPADAIAALCRAEILGPAPITLRASPTASAAITAEQRDELLRRCAAGEYVELVVELLAFEQRPGERNRNAVRFKDSAMRPLAKSGRGIPLLRDHDQYDLLARAGTVLESTHEKSDDGAQRIRMVAKVTAPWAVEAILRGNVDRFSIGWRATGPVICSACGSEVMGDCWHFPGDRLDGADGEGDQVVEWIYTAAELVECSAVSVPAVPSARIEEVRAATLAARDHATATARTAPAQPQESGPMTMIKIATIAAALGLAASLDEEGIVREARAQSTRLHALEEANAALTRRATGAEAELAAIRETTAAREADEFVAGLITEGKLAAGGSAESSLRAYFKIDPAGARKLAAALPRSTPAGSASSTPPPTPPGRATAGRRAWVSSARTARRRASCSTSPSPTTSPSPSSAPTAASAGSTAPGSARPPNAGSASSA